ncbi:hypothetical protein NPA13_01325 [Mycoplasma sp. 2045]|uniref:hypothetical protein n=1 Tax=Mycoplasma sp. 2045 TaxID=2967301 RepID=UPI00211C7BF7|nr:hypothetical protein [Mycoplasma sp. 2045]UUM20638.1 hypothetical protein NPA13_01325 [Mycoplasma sp. 2045]
MTSKTSKRNKKIIILLAFTGVLGAVTAPAVYFGLKYTNKTEETVKVILRNAYTRDEEPETLKSIAKKINGKWEITNPDPENYVLLNKYGGVVDKLIRDEAPISNEFIKIWPKNYDVQVSIARNEFDHDWQDIKDFEIQVNYQDDETRISELIKQKLPSDVKLSSISGVTPWTSEIQIKIVENRKTITIYFNDSHGVIGKREEKIPIKENSIVISSDLVPNDYVLVDSNKQILDSVTVNEITNNTINLTVLPKNYEVRVHIDQNNSHRDDISDFNILVNYQDDETRVKELIEQHLPVDVKVSSISDVKPWIEIFNVNIVENRKTVTINFVDANGSVIGTTTQRINMDENQLTVYSNMVPDSYVLVNSNKEVIESEVIEQIVDNSVNVLVLPKNYNAQVKIVNNESHKQDIQDFEIQVNYQDDEARISELIKQKLPSDVKVSSISGVTPWTSEIQIEIVENRKTITINFKDLNNDIVEITTQKINMDETSFTVSNLLIPDGYVLINSNKQVVDSITINQIENDTVDVKILPQNYSVQVVIANNESHRQDINNFNIDVNYQDDETKVKDLITQQLPTDVKIKSVSGIEPWATSINLDIIENRKTITINFKDLDNNLVSSTTQKINMDENSIIIESNLVPNSYVLIDSNKEVIQSVTIDQIQNNEVNVVIAPQSYTVLINIVQNNTSDQVDNFDVQATAQDTKDNLIELIRNQLDSKYLFELSGEWNKFDKFANIIVNVAQSAESKDDYVAYIRGNLNSLNKVKQNETLFGSDQITNFDLSTLDDYENKSLDELKTLKNEVENILNVANTIATEKVNDAFEQIVQISNNQDNSKYYLKDFLVDKENLSYKFEHDTDKVEFFISRLDEINQIKANIDERIDKGNLLNYLTTNMQYATYLVLNCLNNVDDGYADYVIGPRKLFEGSFKLLSIDNASKYQTLSIRDLKPLFDSGLITLQYKTRLRGRNNDPYIRLDKSSIDYDNEVVTFEYNHDDNEERLLKLEILNNQGNYPYLATTFVKEDKNPIANYWVKTGVVPDLTPAASTIVPNSLDDYWLFPRKYEIKYKERFLQDGTNNVNKNWLNNVINSYANGAWNYKISDGTAFNYQNALWVALLQAFVKTNITSDKFNIDKNTSVFTKTFTEDNSFTFVLNATASKNSSTRDFANIGGAFFEQLIDSSTARHIDFETGDKIRLEFDLDNSRSWHPSIPGNTLPSVISNNLGDFSKTAKAYNFNGYFPINASYYGDLRLKLYVNDNLIWNASTLDGTQSHILPIFVLDKWDVPGSDRKYVLVYTAGSKVAIG